MKYFDESTPENITNNNSIKKDKDTDTIFDNKKIKRRNHQEEPRSNSLTNFVISVIFFYIIYNVNNLNI